MHALGRHDHIKRIPDQQPPQFEIDLFPPLHQRKSDQNFQAVLVESLVPRDVLTLQVGVDRHLRLAASTNRGDEVDRHDSTPSLHFFDHIRRQVNLHSRPSNTTRLNIPSKRERRTKTLPSAQRAKHTTHTHERKTWL